MIKQNVNLEGSQMRRVNLRVASLKNANLQNCNLDCACLAGANLGKFVNIFTLNLTFLFFQFCFS